MALLARKISGAFEKRAPEPSLLVIEKDYSTSPWKLTNL